MSASPSCTVRIYGGLGNQLFQYAAGRALAIKASSPLVLDVTFYARRRHHNLELTSFPVEAEITSTRGLIRKWLRNNSVGKHTYREPHFHYDSRFESLQTPVVLDGYFQSERYFAPHADAIRSELVVPAARDPQSQRLAKQILDSGATSLHLRRGDYVTNPKAQQIYCSCTMDYYQAAMEMIPGNDPVFVFSDDLGWAKENLPRVKPLVFPDPDSGPAESSGRSGLSDLWLMTHARQHIIANSTFSWWGAWLAGKDKGLTIAPKRWFTDPSINDADLIPQDWVRV